MKISYTDWKVKRIPDKWILVLFLAGVAAAWMFPEITVRQRMRGFFLISSLLFFLACFRPGSIGGGDIKLMAAGGFLLGTEGIWSAFVIGISVAAIVSVVLLLQGSVDKETEIALGPFLAFGIGCKILGY